MPIITITANVSIQLPYYYLVYFHSLSVFCCFCVFCCSFLCSWPRHEDVAKIFIQCPVRTYKFPHVIYS